MGTILLPPRPLPRAELSAWELVHDHADRIRVRLSAIYPLNESVIDPSQYAEPLWVGYTPTEVRWARSTPHDRPDLVYLEGEAKFFKGSGLALPDSVAGWWGEIPLLGGTVRTIAAEFPRPAVLVTAGRGVLVVALRLATVRVTDPSEPQERSTCEVVSSIRWEEKGD